MPEVEDAFTRLVVTGVLDQELHDEVTYPERLGAYRDSFLGRTVSSLPNITFSQACRVFGIEVVREICSRFFIVHPPSTSDMLNALKDLPEFIRDSSPNTEGELLACMVEASFARWELIYGPDPESSPTNPSPFLRVIKPKQVVDLYLAWMVAESNGEIADYFTKKTGLLLVKKDPFTIVALEVPKDLLESP